MDAAELAIFHHLFASAAEGVCDGAYDEALVRGLRDWLLWQEKRAGVR